MKTQLFFKKDEHNKKKHKKKNVYITEQFIYVK